MLRIPGRNVARPRAPRAHHRLRSNLIEVAHGLLGSLPDGLLCSDAYRRLRRRLSRQPARYESATRQLPTARDAPGARPSWRGRKLVTAQTDLVIEGFPGSANSFAAHAARSAIDRPAHVESHFHHTVQLVRAVAFGVPTVVIVRPPRDACQSLKSKSPAVADVLIALRWWRYHRFVERHLHRPGFDVVLFEDVTRDPDVLRRQSAGLRRLAARPLVADPTVRRASSTHAPFGGGRLTERLLTASDDVYRSIAAGVHASAESSCRTSAPTSTS